MSQFSQTTIALFALALAITGLVPVAAALPEAGSYKELVSAIRQVKAESRERIEQLVEQERVREAWEIGKLIDEHVLQRKQRADYDKHVIERLATDLGESRTQLYYMLQFARAYPIVPQAEQLSWSHYQALLALNDPEQREELERRAAKENWGRNRLREEVQKKLAANESEIDEWTEPREVPTLTVVLGTPGTYQVVKSNYDGELVLDLGFSNYLFMKDNNNKFPFKEGDIVSAHQGELELKKDPEDSGLFTYKAKVLKVIDGDTLTAAVYLGFGFNTVQKLRLRGLDAPEIESAEGREAKEFLEKRIPKGSAILIRTHRSDKYDRYLADIFVDGEYFNKELVDQGLAVQVSD